MPKLNVIRSPELTPFWQRPPERYAGELPDRTDVLVIGGGITGVSLMHHLRARGSQSALVGRAHIRTYASARCLAHDGGQPRSDDRGGRGPAGWISSPRERDARVRRKGGGAPRGIGAAVARRRLRRDVGRQAPGQSA